jgi:DNA-directed RNA polymerase specialized sigma subunit
MTDVEMYLRDYWHARRSIGRLMLRLTEVRAAYAAGVAEMRSTGGIVKLGDKQYSGTSSVERAAMLLVDELGAEVKSIEKRLADERRTMADIETVVASAGLRKNELEVVRARYFENLSLEAAAQRLYCSKATCWRVKNAALSKIAAAMRNAGLSEAREA